MKQEKTDYVCGHDCKGECSGEVDGKCHCPVTEKKNEVYCAWVNTDVDIMLLGKNCKEWIVDGRCDHCERSEQLNYGVHPDKLLENLRGCP
jgi:hypothetical protein